jgi:hypothetical protein
MRESRLALLLKLCKPTLLRTFVHCNTGKISTELVLSEEHIGQSGRHYRIEQVLRKDTFPIRCVCLAMWVTLITSCCDLPAYYFYSSGDHKYVLKYIHEVNFKYLQDINNRLRGGADHVRLVEDIIPEKSIFVFRYFADHLLHVV